MSESWPKDLMMYPLIIQPHAQCLHQLREPKGTQGVMGVVGDLKPPL